MSTAPRRQGVLGCFSSPHNPGGIPTILSYIHCGGVKSHDFEKIYNATNSLVHFQIKNIFFYFEKLSSLLQRWR
jgi:hypothetical protein